MTEVIIPIYSIGIEPCVDEFRENLIDRQNKQFYCVPDRYLWIRRYANDNCVDNGDWLSHKKFANFSRKWRSVRFEYIAVVGNTILYQ